MTIERIIAICNIPNYDKCTSPSEFERVCFDVLPYPISRDSICQAHLFRNLNRLLISIYEPLPMMEKN